MNRAAIVEIDFAELADGSLVEMIEHPDDATKTLLAVYSDKSVRYTDRIEDRGRILMPLSRADEILRHVHLASGANACDSIPDLITDLINILGDCLDLEWESRALTSAFVISTWLPEKLPMAPYLALVGPPSSGKTTAMQTLNLLCYRGLLTVDISSSAFYDVSHRIRPTVLLDETLTAGRPRELIHLLKTSSAPGNVFLRKGKARLAYGPKVFSWIELPDDESLNSRCIIVPMHRTSQTDLKRPSDPEISQRAKEIRTRLLHLRFDRFRNAPVPKLPSETKLVGRTLDLYRALALPFWGNETACRYLADLVQAQDKFHAPLLSPPQVSVIRVLYHFIHENPESGGLMLSEVTAAVNSDLGRVGEPSGLNERKLGEILRSLSFTNGFRRNAGYVLRLERSDRALIHATASTHRVEGTRLDSIENCRVCTRTGAPVPTVRSTQADAEMAGRECSADLD